MGQQQVQQPGTSRERKQKRRGFSRKKRLIATIIAAFIVALVIATAQVLSGAKIIPDIWATISNAIVGTFGMIFAFFALVPLLFASDDPQPTSATATLAPAPSPVAVSPQPIIIQLQQPASPQPLPPAIPQPPVPEKPVSGNITGSFPPTDPKTIQQRRKLVEEVYAALTQPDMNCLVLTGIGGIGKSTAAALVYNYAEEQRKDGKGLFAAEALWITVEETTATFAYIAETISAVLGKPLADFGKLDFVHFWEMNLLSLASPSEMVRFDQKPLDPDINVRVYDSSRRRNSYACWRTGETHWGKYPFAPLL